jgi:hypothetical protein
VYGIQSLSFFAQLYTENFPCGSTDGQINRQDRAGQDRQERIERTGQDTTDRQCRTGKDTEDRTDKTA